ncbi:MAG: hypothetical protein EXR11_08695 [Rhodospirillaceae bacterium]|nr:hypothetical protein [Rhodospirillaceae bacterium]
MLHTQFEKLADTLLRGGIAPRHVSRYVRELEDHYADLEREARTAGKSATEAEREALARVGSVDDLARAMLERDDLKSVAAKYPALMFGIVPTAALAAICIVSVLMLGVLAMLFRVPGAEHPVFPDWIFTPVKIWNWFLMFVLPIALASVAVAAGIRQRMNPTWIMVGIAVVGFIGGFHDINIIWPAPPGGPGEIQAGLGLLPPFPQFGHGLIRAVINIGVVAACFYVMRLKTASARTTH